uniref:SMP-30/Gluconolactonase/LRE-like region domain-containing protein n=1 Tax=Branchiostoma floridae TaxID=7739 RepID=C3YAV2_BRAFL|eukprot:XP_002606543.1 hypothetical protein BRAFLDRAFT_102540 [Branchiostoma floridae]
MAEDLTSKTVAENSSNGLVRDETRVTLHLTRRRNAARQVDSAGYKGDDEDDDYRMSTKRDAEESSRPPRGVKSKEQHNVEAFAAAYMSKDDLVFIQTASKGMRRKKKPIQTPEPASRGRTDISPTLGACGTRDSVPDVQNTGATRQPPDALSQNPKTSTNARDPNPTYNQDTLEPNACNSNPMYPQSTPMHGSNVPPEPAFDSGGHKPCNPTSSENARDANEDTQRCTSQHPKQMYPQNAQMQQVNAHTEPALDSDNSCIQGDATANHEADEATSRPAAGDGDLTCQPYAVRYREEEDDAVDITPYAVAYMGQDEADSNEQTDTNTPLSSCNDSDSIFDYTLQAPVQNWLSPNPMYLQNAGNPNPPVPNAGQDSDCVCTSSYVCTALTIAIVLVLLIVGGAFVGMYLSTIEQDSQKPTKSVDTVRAPGHPAVDSPSTPGQPGCCISERTAMVDLLFKPTVRSAGGQTTTIASTSPQGVVPPSTSVSSQESYVNSKPIVLGGDGTSALPGNFSDPSGVSVSAEEEIFVADVVQYSGEGLPVATFAVPRLAWFPRISVNARDNNRIIVVASDEILVFKPADRSFKRSFGKEEGKEPHYVTTDKDGNILVTDASESSLSLVHVYDHNGRCLFSFGTGSKPRGICTDPLGHIFVATSANNEGRVDMFTSRGEFVRTVVNVTNPWGIAIGPGGQLVVTNSFDDIVTIFPRRMVFPND